MGSPEKPFSCLESGCGASFTNEDRLSVHARKHDMVLQLGAKGGAYVADQTPTPTRFIRNCEEVGLFQDLQNVNPFEETFKRAMEVRTGTNHLTLDGHLMAAASDDTLHTPHIFPHLPEENSSGLYSSNTERTTVNRLSSDEGSNQLTVVKCMSSSVEDNLSSVGLHDNDKDEKHDRKVTVLVERKIKKKLSSSSSKSKLTRQNSIDLPDELTTPGVRQFSHDILSGSSQCKDANVKDNEQNTIGLKDSTETNDSRVLQIPVISISETPKGNANSLDAAAQNDGSNPVTKGDEQRIESISDITVSKKFLDVKSCLKSNYSKLISQKSIDMALIHFTNEAHSKMMDLNNISIEDLPDSTSVIKESVSCSQNELKIVNDGSVQTVNRRKRFLLSRSKSGSRNISQDSAMNSEGSAPRNDEHAATVRLDSIGGSISSDAHDSGYELMLKWPDGKKVYLKEVHRDAKSATEQKKNAAPETYQNVSNHRDETVVKNTNMKQKLKDFINSSNQQVDNTTLNQLPIQNSITILPENYVIVPQITALDSNIPVSSVLTSNMQFLSVLSPPTKIQSQVFFPGKTADAFGHQRQIVPDGRTAQPNVIRTISGGNIYGGDEVIILPKPVVRKTPPVVIKDSYNLKAFLNENVTNKRRTDDGLGAALNDRAKILKTSKAGAINASGASGQRDAKGGKPADNKRQTVQERNRAAVWRYRIKKQNKFQTLQETNKKLEKMNENLLDKLQAAMEEIQELRQALAARADSDRRSSSYGTSSVITPSQRGNQRVTSTHVGKNTQSDPSKIANNVELINATNPASNSKDFNNFINNAVDNLGNTQHNHSYVKVINDTSKNVIQHLRMADEAYDVANAGGNLNTMHDSGNIVTIDLDSPPENINSPFDDSFGKDMSKESKMSSNTASVINSTIYDGNIFKVLNTKRHTIDISRSRKDSNGGTNDDLQTPESNMAMFLKDVKLEKGALVKQERESDSVITGNMK